MANIFKIDRPTNTITLGTTGTTINIASHNASKTLALDADKNLESIQDVRQTASPTFAGLTISEVAELPSPAIEGKIVRLQTDSLLYFGKVI